MAGTGRGSTPRQQVLGDRIKQRRHDIGLSQEALANKAGINRTYIGSLETGERNPSLDTVARLAKALECDVADLVSGLQDIPGRNDPPLASKQKRKAPRSPGA